MQKLTPPAPINQTVELPGGHLATFSFQPPDLIGMEITPWPSFAEPSGAIEFLRAYTAAREGFLATVATLTGLSIAVVDELPDGTEAIGSPIAPAVRQ